MTKFKMLLFLVLIPGFLCSQTLKPGVAFAKIPDLHINGYKISNHFSFPGAIVNLDLGIGFIFGSGNPNVVFADSMNYRIDFRRRGSSELYITSLDPLTTRTAQFNGSLGISRGFTIGPTGLFFSLGGYFSRTSTHFLIGPFKDADVYWMGINTNTGNLVVVDSTQWDVMFPVNLRYINAGVYAGAEWVLLKDKPTPLGIECKYYAGLHGKHIITIGVNFHLPVKRSSESMATPEP